MTRVRSGVVRRLPWAKRKTCARGHRWTPQTTRWRIRADKGEKTPTRDCLVCKHDSEARRLAKRLAGGA